MPPPAVGAPDLSGLIELSRDPQLDLKPVVLRVQTDLFLAAPIRDRAVLEAFEALATGLIPIVDDETVLTVARKLAPCADTPDGVLARLAARGGAICDAVLEAAAELGPLAREAARAAGADPDAVLAAEAAAAPAEAANEGMEGPALPQRDERLPGEVLTHLLKLGRGDPELAQDLLARADLARADLAPLWLHADPQQRAEIRDAVAATAALRRCPPVRHDLGARLSVHSGARDVAAFIATLAEGLGVSRSFVAAAPDPATRYDLLTLALRAAGLREAEAIFIFLTLNETVARSVERVFALTALFRSLDRPTARDLLSAILDVELPDRARLGHQPYLAPDAAAPRHAAAAERAAPRLLPVLARRMN